MTNWSDDAIDSATCIICLGPHCSCWDAAVIQEARHAALSQSEYERELEERLRVVTERMDGYRELLARALIGLTDCATELGEWVEQHYAPTKDYPSEMRRYERDIEPVNTATALCAEIRAALNPEQEKPT